MIAAAWSERTEQMDRRNPFEIWGVIGSNNTNLRKTEVSGMLWNDRKKAMISLHRRIK